VKDIAVVGVGYVGLVTGACFADLGNRVVALDIDAARIAGLARGEMPIYEPGLEELVERNVKAGRLHFTTSYEEALRSAGLWDKVESRLVMGENIAQTAQYVQTGNADVGIIALSLALNRTLAAKGGYALIPDKLHQPLEQGFIVTRRAAANPLAKKFADYMVSPEARRVMVRYGFVLAGEAAR